jgi:hypothetical protein
VPSTSSFTLTREQRETFHHEGVLRLPGFYGADETSLMAERLWADLQRRYGILRDRPETWTTVRPAQFQSLVRSGAFDALGSPALSDLADAWLGAWEPPRRWGMPLVTFPSAVWDLPRPMWHLDYPAVDHGLDVPVLRAFAFLAPVRPHGGGTLYAAGSHRVVMALAAGDDRPVPSAKMRERLKASEPWFARLWATPGEGVRELMGQGAKVRGVEVSVGEMTGEPRDLILMHPLVVHALSHNALDTPRMMLVQSVDRRA